jgi:hypothetical protein
MFWLWPLGVAEPPPTTTCRWPKPPSSRPLGSGGSNIFPHRGHFFMNKKINKLKILKKKELIMKNDKLFVDLFF